MRTSENAVKTKFAGHSCFSARSNGKIRDIVLFGKEDTIDVLVQSKNPYLRESRSTLHG